MAKKYTKLSTRILSHILSWGDSLTGTEGWTKSDANVYDLVNKEIRRIRHAAYLKSKKK